MSTETARTQPHPIGAIRSQGPLLTLLALCAAASICFPDFLDPENFANIFRQAGMIGLVSIGMTFVILSGGIDLSVGSTAAVASILAARLSNHNEWAAVSIPVLVGLCVGTANGTLVTRLKIPPFVATLATMLGVRGLAFVLCDGESVTSNTTGWFSQISKGDLLGIPFLGLILLLALAIATVVSKYTPFGRAVYAVGGNEEAARMMGIRVRRTKMLVYVLCGGCAGAAGVLLASRLGSVLPKGAQGWELAAIAAVVVGGTALTGGVGNVTNTLYGVLILGVIPNIINLIGTLPLPHWARDVVTAIWINHVVTGLLLLAVIVLQSRIGQDAGTRK